MILFSITTQIKIQFNKSSRTISIKRLTNIQVKSSAHTQYPTYKIKRERQKKFNN